MDRRIKRIIVEVDNEYAEKELLAILNKLKQLGSMGCSRTVSFEEFGNLSWDGDGPSGIKSIKVERALSLDHEK